MRNANMHHSSLRGFTLIELLIVVAIIAILAAIAVPNFLEAQTRSKVSRARADMRSAATALEAYYVDSNRYPPTPFVDTAFDGGVLRVMPNVLTTPISYISSVFYDPFIIQLSSFQGLTRAGLTAFYTGDASTNFNDPGFDAVAGRRYYYQSNDDRRRSASSQQILTDFVQPIEGKWTLASLGPNKKRDYVTIDSNPDFQVLEPYDPTNGTISAGDLVRTQRESQGTRKPL